MVESRRFFGSFDTFKGRTLKILELPNEAQFEARFVAFLVPTNLIILYFTARYFRAIFHEFSYLLALFFKYIKKSGQKDPSPCERSELTSLRVRHYRPRRAAGSPSAQRNTPLAPHIIDTALGSPLAPHPAGNSIKYRNGCVGLMEVGRRLTDCWVQILNLKS